MVENHTHAKSLYRPEIDGLRAFAVMTVIINHFDRNLLPGGYLGVDIFFVISGFVITSSIYKRSIENFNEFISGFYERRIKRLVPALSVCVVITSITICLFNPYPRISLFTGLASLFGISNLYLLKQSTDYFAQSTELNIFTHTWSLGVEEQFYILFPFLIWLSGFGREIKNGARNLFLIIGALTISSLIVFLNLYTTNLPAAYFLMPSRFWEMALGCLLFLGLQKKKIFDQYLEKIPPLLIIFLIIGVMYLPYSWAPIATILVALLTFILLVSLKKDTAVFKIFTNKKVVYIGLISYSLYLWHWSVLSISRWTIGIHWWSVPFQIAIMFGLAVASYRWIENPLRKSAFFELRWKTFIATGSSLSTSSAILLGLYIPLDGISISREIFKLSNGSEYQKQLSAKKWNDKSNPEEIRQFALCHFSRNVVEADLKRCILTNIEEKELLNENRFFIVGDSHAANYAFGFKKAFPGKVSLFTIGNECGYLPKNDAIKNPLVNCLDYINLVDELAESMGRNDFLILGNDWQSTSIKRKSKDIENAIRKLALKTTKNGAFFILLDDVPDLGHPINSIKTWYRPFDSRAITKEQVKRDQIKLDNIGNRLTKDLPNASYLSLRDELCKPVVCSVLLDGEIIYFDKGHLTFKASEMLKDKITEFIKNIKN